MRTVETDSLGRIDPGAFERALRATDGPMIAIAQAGQINTGACDPFAEIAPMARARGAWLHVDGAFGLWAQTCPARAHLTAGVELCDSWATDGHKWLQTPYDCGYAIVRHAEAHRRAMTVIASYLPVPEGAERDPSACVPELSRRARGFATWAMIKQFGRAGIAEMVDRCCVLAAHMAEQLGEILGVEVVCPVELNQFMIRFGGDADGDRLTLETIRLIQEDAVAFIASAQWRDRWVMRVSVISAATTLEDADKTVEAVIDAWRKAQDSTALGILAVRYGSCNLAAILARSRRSDHLDVVPQSQHFAHAVIVGFDRQNASDPAPPVGRRCGFVSRGHHVRAQHTQQHPALRR